MLKKMLEQHDVSDFVSAAPKMRDRFHDDFCNKCFAPLPLRGKRRPHDKEKSIVGVLTAFPCVDTSADLELELQKQYKTLFR